MKKIILLILVFTIVFLIYTFNINKKIYYLSAGDYLSYGIDNLGNTINGYSNNIKNKYRGKLGNYVNYSFVEDYKVMDLINDITYNRDVNYNGKNYKLQNLLIKSNLITISIGMNDLIYKKNITYEYVDNLLDDIDRLLVYIRKYNKDKIFFIGFYNIINNKDIIEYANKRLENICNKNSVNFVDITNLEDYFDGLYPKKEGYLYISNKIINFTK